MADRAAWERRDDETDKAYACFVEYRLLPAAERSIVQAWRNYSGKDAEQRRSKAPRGVEDWSSKFEWVKRAAEYDSRLADQAREQFEAERLKQRDQRQQIVRALQGMAARVMTHQRDNMQGENMMTPQELNALAAAVGRVLNESRMEFNDLPAQRAINENRGANEDGSHTIRVVYEQRDKILPDVTGGDNGG